MSSSSHDPLGYVVLGFFAGLYYFYKGFKTFREYRVVEDTPEARIRSVPMGLVDIQGQAVGEETLLSPLTHTPCYLCQVNIEQWHTDSKGGGSWKHYATDLQSVKFYLQDASGKVLIDATGAELDLAAGAKREVRSGHQTASLSASSTAGAGNPAPDTELLRYVSEAKMRHVGQMAGKVVGLVSHGGDSPHAQGREALMQFLANPTGAAGGDFAGMMMRSMVARRDPGGEMPRAALELWKYPQDSPAFQVSLQHFAQTYARVMGNGVHGQLPLPANIMGELHQHSEQVLTAAAALAGGMEPQADPANERARQAALAYSHASVPALFHQAAQPASGHYRLTESCLVPNGNYNITGTCTENPNPRDEHDRNMIIKGRNESTFIISYRSHKEEERHLEKRAALQILGGAAASIACLAYVLYRLHMF